MYNRQDFNGVCFLTEAAGLSDELFFGGRNIDVFIYTLLRLVLMSPLDGMCHKKRLIQTVKRYGCLN